MPLKIDLHVHTIYSDGKGGINEVLKTAKRKGMNGIAITDHNTIKGYLKANELNNDKEFIVIPGIEVETNAGHIIILGIKEEPSIRGKADYEELIEWVKENNGLAIIAHPAIGRFKMKKWMNKKPDAIEVLNSLYPTSILVRRGIKLAKKLNLPATAGSDAHHLEDIADAFTTVNVNSLKTEEILQAIREGKIEIRGKLTPLKMRLEIGLKFMIKSILKQNCMRACNHNNFQ